MAMLCFVLAPTLAAEPSALRYFTWYGADATQPGNLAFSSNLTELDARGSRMSAVGVASLLGGLPGLTRLALFASPHVVSSDEGAQLATALRRATQLRHLDLGACGVTVNALRAVRAAIVATGSALRTLELFGNGDEATVATWKAELAALREACPDLDVAWKEPANG